MPLLAPTPKEIAEKLFVTPNARQENRVERKYFENAMIIIYNLGD